MPPDEAPRTRFDLIDLLRPADSRYAGRVATYDIEALGRRLSLRVHRLAAGDDLRQPDRGLRPLRRRRHLLLGGDHRGRRRGPLPDRLQRARLLRARPRREDPRIAVVAPEDYTLVLCRAAMIPKGAPNPTAAGPLIDFMLSDAGRAALAEQYLSSRAGGGRAARRPGLALSPDPLSPTLLLGLDQQKRARFLAAGGRPLLNDRRGCAAWRVQRRRSPTTSRTTWWVTTKRDVGPRDQRQTTISALPAGEGQECPSGGARRRGPRSGEDERDRRSNRQKATLHRTRRAGARMGRSGVGGANPDADDELGGQDRLGRGPVMDETGEAHRRGHEQRSRELRRRRAHPRSDPPAQPLRRSPAGPAAKEVPPGPSRPARSPAEDPISSVISSGASVTTERARGWHGSAMQRYHGAVLATKMIMSSRPRALLKRWWAGRTHQPPEGQSRPRPATNTNSGTRATDRPSR